MDRDFITAEINNETRETADKRTLDTAPEAVK